MAREVDIWWESGGRLKASLKWTNKRGRISFTLVPASYAKCDKCPFENNQICSKWRKVKPERRATGHLCSMLWTMKGNNQFERRDSFHGWQPLGPLGREKKKNRKT